MVNDFFTQDLFLAKPLTGVQPASVGASRITTGFANPTVVAQVSKPAARPNYPYRAPFRTPCRLGSRRYGRFVPQARDAVRSRALAAVAKIMQSRGTKCV